MMALTCNCSRGCVSDGGDIAVCFLGSSSFNISVSFDVYTVFTVVSIGADFSPIFTYSPPCPNISTFDLAHIYITNHF